MLGLAWVCAGGCVAPPPLSPRRRPAGPDSRRGRRRVDGAQAKEYMDKGALVPDELMIDLVKKKLEEPEVRQGGGGGLEGL